MKHNTENQNDFKLGKLAAMNSSGLSLPYITRTCTVVCFTFTQIYTEKPRQYVCS